MDKGLFDGAGPWAYIGGAGMLGRLMYHAKMVSIGKRKPFTWALLFDIPIALSTGWIAFGFGVQMGWTWEAQVSAAIVSSYLGPYGIDTIFAAWANRFKGSKNGTPSQ